MNTTDDTNKSLTDLSSGRFGAILEEIQPAEQNIVTLFNPYFRGKKRDILPFALNLYKQGSLEGERQILDGENIPFVASWSMKSCFIPVGSNHCRIQFNRNPELSYELLIVNYQLVDYLIDVIVNYRQKRGVDFSKSFYFQMLQIEL